MDCGWLVVHEDWGGESYLVVVVVPVLSLHSAGLEAISLQQSLASHHDTFTSETETDFFQHIYFKVVVLYMIWLRLRCFLLYLNLLLSRLCRPCQLSYVFQINQQNFPVSTKCFLLLECWSRLWSFFFWLTSNLSVPGKKKLQSF